MQKNKVEEATDMTPLSYGLERFDMNGNARYLLICLKTNNVPISASLYETVLHSGRSYKTGTAGTVMQNLAYFYTWAELFEINLNSILFSGEGLTFCQIEKFVKWLEGRKNKKTLKKLSDGYKAHILKDCRRLVIWFVLRYVRARPGERMNWVIKCAVKANEAVWDANLIHRDKDVSLPDITVEDYLKIECYLRGGNLNLEGFSARQIRNYLMWRIVWEFGIRIGELLAIRLQDIKLYGEFTYIEIVRLDEREEGYRDVREPYAPRVKTRSRALGFIYPKTELISLIELYVSKYRSVSRSLNGKRVMVPYLNHDFLLVSHGGAGSPMSTASAQKVARVISENTGVHFKWHLVRHAFFNRRYKEAKSNIDGSMALEQIIYWGGWADANSLAIYNRRAIRDQSVSSLKLVNSFGGY